MFLCSCVLLLVRKYGGIVRPLVSNMRETINVDHTFFHPMVYFMQNNSKGESRASYCNTQSGVLPWQPFPGSDNFQKQMGFSICLWFFFPVVEKNLMKWTRPNKFIALLQYCVGRGFPTFCLIINTLINEINTYTHTIKVMCVHS